MKSSKRKSYLVTHHKGLFKIFLSPFKNNGFVGSVLYYTKKPRQKNSEVSVMHFDLKTVFNSTEEAVLRDCTNWIEKNLGTDFEVKEVDD